MVLSLVACGSSEPAADDTTADESGTTTPVAGAEAEAGVLRVAASYDITTMDVAQTTDNYMVPMNIFDRLFEVEVQDDGSSEVVPSLCESYTVSEDGLTYSFKLKEGIVFSNESALTASDVQYTF